MANLNPVSLWRGLLALPNESRTKTLAMSVLVSTACALAVSSAAVLLGPRLDANRAAEQQARLDALVASLPGLSDLLAESGADTLDALVVDLRTGGVAEGIDPDNFDPDTAAAESSTELAPEVDIAGLGTRADLARLYVVRSGGDVSLVVLPMAGAGYQSQIEGFLALEGDLNTIAGLTITNQGETPGLGAKIEDAAWQDLWPGKKLAGEDGEIRLSVVRGQATTEFEVDGITGATRTSNGVQNMVRFWTGPNGFGPVLDALRAGEI